MDSFIGWVGGKKALRNKIIEKFPKEEFASYVEVFGGAGWVMFQKEHKASQKEVFNDIDSNLANLYRCIKYHQRELERELQFVISSREFFYDVKEQMEIRGQTDIQRAARYLYLIRISFGCKKDSFATCTRRLDTTIKRLPRITERLQGVVIENKDFEDLIKIYDRKSALFYLDPPYHGTEKLYKNQNRGFTVDDHYRLKACLDNLKGTFILSYNEDDFIKDLYKGYNISFVIRKNQLSSDSNNTEFRELIITNY